MLRTARAPQLSDDEADELERVFKALADRHRVKILNRLLAAGGEAVCVCDFEDMLGLKQSTTSYHLKQLLDAGIIARERRGKFAYFTVIPGALQRVGELLTAPALDRGLTPLAPKPLRPWVAEPSSDQVGRMYPGVGDRNASGGPDRVARGDRPAMLDQH